MKIVSWNINGIRACYQKGLLDFLDKENADIVCLQEIKASADQFPKEILSKHPLHFIYPADKKGYSGVALFSKTAPLKIDYGLNIPDIDSEGRVIIAEYEHFILFNCYFPNGQRDHARVPYKLAFSDKILKKALQLKKNKNKKIIICGDVNTAHQEIDLANPKSNVKTTGFLPIERAWMDKFVSFGFIDCFRHLNPNIPHHYTWWTYRGDCRERNIGWRIDYFFMTKDFLPTLKKCYHLPEVLGSDHCPVVLILK